MAMIRTKTVLDALKTTLEAMTFPVGHAFAGQPFFGSVRLYDVENIEMAIKDLLEFTDQRLCLVVPVGDLIGNDQQGGRLVSLRTGIFTLVLTDKDYEPGKPAMFGDGVSFPGLIDLKDDVIELIIGESLGIRGAIVQPFEGESDRFHNNTKEYQKGREGYVLKLLISMGRKETTLNRGSTTYRSS